VKKLTLAYFYIERFADEREQSGSEVDRALFIDGHVHADKAAIG